MQIAHTGFLWKKINQKRQVLQDHQAIRRPDSSLNEFRPKPTNNFLQVWVRKFLIDSWVKYLVNKDGKAFRKGTKREAKDSQANRQESFLR